MRMGNDAPVTAKEIGKRLGLSQPTVSRILSGANNHRVAPETRQRVMEAAVRLGYRPNAVARSLRRGRTNIVGLYTGYGYLDARNPFQAELIGGLQRAADKRQLDVLLHGVFRGGSTDDIFGELVDGRIDGLFINTFPDDPLVARLRDSSLPVVAIADAIPGIPSVVADDAGGTQILLDALWERGHRRIWYFRPSKSFASVERRVQAFRVWAEAHHCWPEDFQVCELDFEWTEPALEQLLSLPPSERPTAVCCWNDMTAFDLLLQCRKRGISVPDTLAVVGFDGLLTDPRMHARALVSVGASWSEITEQAATFLMRQINHRFSDSSNTTPGDTFQEGEAASLLTCLPVTLVDGDTM